MSDIKDKTQEDWDDAQELITQLLSENDALKKERDKFKAGVQEAICHLSPAGCKAMNEAMEENTELPKELEG